MQDRYASPTFFKISKKKPGLEVQPGLEIYWLREMLTEPVVVIWRDYQLVSLTLP